MIRLSLIAVPLAILFLLGSATAYFGISAWQQWLVYEQYGVAGPVLEGFLGAVDSPTMLLPGSVLTGAGGWWIKPLGNFAWGSGANTLCEAYVENKLGIGNQGLTAADAASRLAAQGLLKQGTPPAGSIVYFGATADNENDGHVGIAGADGTFVSITASGLAVAPIAAWTQHSAPLLGYVLPGSIVNDRFGRPVHAG